MACGGAAEVLCRTGRRSTSTAPSRGGAHTSPGNETLDRSLRAGDPVWGMRDLDAVAELARAAGSSEPSVTGMPADNLGVVFRRLR